MKTKPTLRKHGGWLLARRERLNEPLVSAVREWERTRTSAAVYAATSEGKALVAMITKVETPRSITQRLEKFNAIADECERDIEKLRNGRIYS